MNEHRLSPYANRAIRFLGLRELHSCTLKIYSIECGDDEFDRAGFEPRLELVSRELPPHEPPTEVFLRDSCQRRLADACVLFCAWAIEIACFERGRDDLDSFAIGIVAVLPILVLLIVDVVLFFEVGG